jgi:hypothetical protein
MRRQKRGTADISTTGLGAHSSIPLDTKLNVRLGANYLNHSYNGNTSDVNYDFKLKLRTFDALLDYFPMDSAFRLTGGIAYNDSRAMVSADQPSMGYTT